MIENTHDIMIKDRRIRVREIIETESISIKWLQDFCTNQSDMKDFPQDGWHDCLQLTTNTDVCYLQKSFNVGKMQSDIFLVSDTGEQHTIQTVGWERRICSKEG